MKGTIEWNRRYQRETMEENVKILRERKRLVHIHILISIQFVQAASTPFRSSSYICMSSAMCFYARWEISHITSFFYIYMILLYAYSIIIIFIAFRAAHFDRSTLFFACLTLLCSALLCSFPFICRSLSLFDGRSLYFSSERVRTRLWHWFIFEPFYICIGVSVFVCVFLMWMDFHPRAQCNLQCRIISYNQCFNPPQIHMDVGIICVSLTIPTIAMELMTEKNKKYLYRYISFGFFVYLHAINFSSASCFFFPSFC